MNNFRAYYLTFVISLFFIFTVHAGDAMGAGDDWKKELREVCSKVQVADEMTIKQLEDLIEQADELTIKISTSGDRRMKIFVMRLQKCKSFFEFTIETKKSRK